jgi:hypothetical protein
MKRAIPIGPTESIADVMAAVEEAVAALRETRRVGDLATASSVFAVKRRLERLGGQLLMSGQPPPPELSRHRSGRWREFAKMSPEGFEQSLCRAVERQAAERGSCDGIRMCRSPWQRDEHGNQTRFIYAADPTAGRLELGGSSSRFDEVEATGGRPHFVDTILEIA